MPQLSCTAHSVALFKPRDFSSCAIICNALQFSVGLPNLIQAKRHEKKFWSFVACKLTNFLFPLYLFLTYFIVFFSAFLSEKKFNFCALHRGSAFGFVT